MIHLNIQIFINQESKQLNLLLHYLLDCESTFFISTFAQNLVRVSGQYLSHRVLSHIKIHKFLVRDLNLSCKQAVIFEALDDKLLEKQVLLRELLYNLAVLD